MCVHLGCPRRAPHLHIPVTQVVELDLQYRQRVHAQQIHTYMYGQVIAPPRGLTASVIGDADFDGHLAPSSSVIPFGELSFLRIGESELLPVTIFLKGLLTYLSTQNRWHRRLRFRSARRVL